jgi:hypothetical protein
MVNTLFVDFEVVEPPWPQAASTMRKSASRKKTAVFIGIFVFLDE